MYNPKLSNKLIIVLFTIISKAKYSQSKLFSAIANRQLTDALEELESLGIYGDIALLTLAWFGGGK